MTSSPQFPSIWLPNLWSARSGHSPSSVCLWSVAVPAPKRSSLPSYPQYHSSVFEPCLGLVSALSFYCRVTCLLHRVWSASRPFYASWAKPIWLLWRTFRLPCTIGQFTAFTWLSWTVPLTWTQAWSGGSWASSDGLLECCPSCIISKTWWSHPTSSAAFSEPTSLLWCQIKCTHPPWWFRRPAEVSGTLWLSTEPYGQWSKLLFWPFTNLALPPLVSIWPNLSTPGFSSFGGILTLLRQILRPKFMQLTSSPSKLKPMPRRVSCSVPQVKVSA